MMSIRELRHRRFLQQIADGTLAAIRGGSFFIGEGVYDLRTRDSARDTQCYPQNHPTLHNWPSPSTNIHHGSVPTWFSIHEISTLECTFLLSNTLRNNNCTHDKIGILNFANATRPGGGFLSGSQAQEESLARSSTLYATLRTQEASNFYELHKTEQNPFYSHSMIYSPGVEIFRDDDGRWIRPVTVDVLTSAAVNAKEVRELMHGRSGRRAIEHKIELVMKERMARILCLFELRGARNLVLGSFGTGVFRNDVGLVAGLWAELLAVEGARFKHSFDRVIFAIIGTTTVMEFKDAFIRRCSRGTA